MCYYTEQNESLAEIAVRFKATIDNPNKFSQSDFINGFEHPANPIILDSSPNIVTTNYNWGLIPSWSKDIGIRKGTLNARIETIEDKPAFKNIINNRCLIIVTGYYEWRWNDEKGKVKKKYRIKNQDDNIFCLGGLYSEWVNPLTGEVLHTYTMVTTEANDTMKYVHNHKHRMPVMLNVNDELSWLDKSRSVKDFAYPTYKPNLVALPV